MKVALAFAALAICIVINAEPTPIVLWHGVRNAHVPLASLQLAVNLIFTDI
jgi:hypothetical protein